MMDRKDELGYLLCFAVEGCFDIEVCCRQLRCLWTAYCMHQNLDVDTAQYDSDLAEVWGQVSQHEEDTAYWSNLDSFDNFMCQELV